MSVQGVSEYIADIYKDGKRLRFLVEDGHFSVVPNDAGSARVSSVLNGALIRYVDAKSPEEVERYLRNEGASA